MKVLIEAIKEKIKDFLYSKCILCDEHDEDDNLETIMEIVHNHRFCTYYHKSCLHSVCSNPEAHTGYQVRKASDIIKQIQEDKEMRARAKVIREKQYKDNCKYLKEHCAENI